MKWLQAMLNSKNNSDQHPIKLNCSVAGLVKFCGILCALIALGVAEIARANDDSSFLAYGLSAAFLILSIQLLMAKSYVEIRSDSVTVYNRLFSKATFHQAPTRSFSAVEVAIKGEDSGTPNDRQYFYMWLIARDEALTAENHKGLAKFCNRMMHNNTMGAADVNLGNYYSSYSSKKAMAVARKISELTSLPIKVAESDKRYFDNI